ncbi:MAG TPA: PP2C family protein-serine/threonine phosphatase [Candidatus Limnocylindria bacterium]|jgi:sigma-B regulation protein RsbU (phosphoserine phosphatase)|nr:PP2C family protein-serine/threonine phosphatase [Candidatus Limnocylindria bacterium]
MDASIRHAVAALTRGSDADLQFDLAAERIQRALLEVVVPQLDGVEIGVRAEAARLVGGDTIDVFPSGDKLVFAMGDASGKSLAAAMTALMLRYLVRGLLRALGTESLPLVMNHVNGVVSEDLDDGTFITFLLGVYEANRGVLRFVNAGHEPPLVLRREAQRLETFDTHGVVLGVQQGAPYPEGSCRLGPGDQVVLYTDGLTEATNERGELYTLARLEENLLALRDRPAQEVADAVFDTVCAYAAGTMRDDATILVLCAR